LEKVQMAITQENELRTVARVAQSEQDTASHKQPFKKHVQTADYLHIIIRAPQSQRTVPHSRRCQG
jgi:hypothetical protein